ncbi:MAG: helix-turn-helix transcriptional regulator [Spirochaetia bacterium]|nr:helix-turn-helix transcriptional regulator [Spirochaetia bacterium]
MVSAVVFSESIQVRRHLANFFKESQASQIVCCSGLYQIFFDAVIMDTTHLAVIDITGMNISVSGFINRILSFNPNVDIIAVHTGSLDTLVRSAVYSSGVKHITFFSTAYKDIHAVSNIIASYLAVFLYALSAREQQVLRMISEGMKTFEIAEAMGISSTTVTVYRKKISQKIGSNRIAVQTRTAMQLNLTSL